MSRPANPAALKPRVVTIADPHGAEGSIRHSADLAVCGMGRPGDAAWLRGRVSVLIRTGATTVQLWPTAAECWAMSEALLGAAIQSEQAAFHERD